MIHVVIPHLNNRERLEACLTALAKQTFTDFRVLVVDNGSHDDGQAMIEKHASLDLRWLRQEENLGFAGGVNVGISEALIVGSPFVALLNDDMLPDPDWLTQIIFAAENRELDIVAAKQVDLANQRIDSAGEAYSIWGLPAPIGRNRPLTEYSKDDGSIFAASGGASLFRTTVFNKIGLFDEDFFAYYEDVDLSFRARLAGFTIGFAPLATVGHHIGGTSTAMKGFTTYQTFKNLPWLLLKNMPLKLLVRSWPRFTIAYWILFASAVRKGNGLYALKGVAVNTLKTPKKLIERFRIQRANTLPSNELQAALLTTIPKSYSKLHRLLSR